MILDRIENAGQYAHLHPGFGKAFQFLRHQGLAALPCGKHEIEGGRIYAIVARNQARSRDKAVLEAHRKYVDIQAVLSGTDEMGWMPRGVCTAPTGPYDAAKDVEFFSDPAGAWVTVRPGQFVVFFPDDAHAPLVGEGDIHKIVVKVAVDLTARTGR